MKFTLITTNGRIMQFFIGSVAELYQQLYGGVIITAAVLETETSLTN